MACTSKEQLGQSSDFLKVVNMNNMPAKHRHRHALVTTPSKIVCPALGLASSVPIRRERSQGEALHLASRFGEKGLCLG